MGNQQRGGTILGFILGLLIGLGIALGVAVYVTKVPVPFSNRDAPQGASNNSNDRNWDPDAPLYGARPTPSTPATSVPATPASGVTAVQPATPATTTADPLGDLAAAQLKAEAAKTAAAQTASDGFSYFVQAGAFRAKIDADAQKAKLAIQGWEARISEREQNGRTVFRVRVGPFAQRAEAEQIKHKLDSAGIDSALIRVNS